MARYEKGFFSLLCVLLFIVLGLMQSARAPVGSRCVRHCAAKGLDWPVLCRHCCDERESCRRRCQEVGVETRQQQLIFDLPTQQKKKKKCSESTSFCCNLAQWLDVMHQYLNADGKGPGFRYYTTLPTDALMEFRDVMKEVVRAADVDLAFRLNPDTCLCHLGRQCWFGETQDSNVGSGKIDFSH
jgi:hypothetical protein